MVNGGFEDSDTSFAPWLVWGSGGGNYGMENYSWSTTWGSDIYTGTLHTSGGSGDNGNWLEVGLAGTNTTTWAWGYNVTFQGKTPDGQDALPVTVGTPITLNADYKSNTVTSVLLGYEWCGADGSLLDYNGDGYANGDGSDKQNIFVPLTPDGTWQRVSTTVFVPALDLMGNPLVGLTQMIAVFGGAGAGQDLGLDNVGFLIPEPISIVLLGLGGLMLRRKKRS